MGPGRGSDDSVRRKMDWGGLPHRYCNVSGRGNRKIGGERIGRDARKSESRARMGSLKPCRSSELLRLVGFPLLFHRPRFSVSLRGAFGEDPFPHTLCRCRQEILL
ncbi:MAG: hypothetical protein OK454_07360 [Thaumarchaeota archaeon]|nr:hypothetical protein [Nitrososphaerota archaeon]